MRRKNSLLNSCCKRRLCVRVQPCQDLVGQTVVPALGGGNRSAGVPGYRALEDPSGPVPQHPLPAGAAEPEGECFVNHHLHATAFMPRHAPKGLDVLSLSHTLPGGNTED